MTNRWDVIIGTRPEAIKLAPVLTACLAHHQPVRVILTGQHTTLLHGISLPSVPVVALNLPSDNHPMAYVDLLRHHVGRALVDPGPPAWLLVQGDTASAYAGMMAAHDKGIPVAHIEAGVRSGDLANPWPEERFRRAISHLATVHYAATDHAQSNLLTEGISPTQVLVTGNTGIDALRQLVPYRPPVHTILPRCLVTLHRRESFGTPLQRIIDGLLAACREHPDIEFWWPTHPNPSVLRAIPDDRPPNLFVTGPWDWKEFVMALSRSRAVLTDSGGVQEEATALGVPAAVARLVTDRPEAIQAGMAVLVGTKAEDVAAGLRSCLGPFPCSPSHLYGDGTASTKIVEDLMTRTSREVELQQA